MNLQLVSCQPSSAPKSTPPLFVHGAWHSAWCWDENFLPYFAAHGYAAHALSLRGHGASEGRSRLRWASLADYAEDVDSVAATLPAPPVVVGHSMGGMVVQHYLAAHRAPAAVLLASAPPAGVIPTTLRVARAHPLTFLKTNLTLSLYPIVGTPELAREFLFSQAMPRAIRRLLRQTARRIVPCLSRHDAAQPAKSQAGPKHTRPRPRSGGRQSFRRV
jgi:pimeloyl-ACP methyl ester carboxylesterase